MKKLLLLLLPLMAAGAGEPLNVALSRFGTSVEVEPAAQGDFSRPEGVIDGDLSDLGALRITGVPAEFTLCFPEEREVNRVRIYPGLLGNRRNPSGSCAPLSYELEGYVNNGWAPLVKAENAAPPDNRAEIGTYFFEHTFPAVYLSKLRFRVLASGDTGKRQGADKPVPEQERVTAIREIRLYEAFPGRHGLVRAAESLSGDFRNAFYRNASKAELEIVAAPGFRPDGDAVLTLSSPGGERVLKSLPVTLRPGDNRIGLDIAGLPSGYYPVELKVKSGDSAESLRRRLRIDNGTPVPVMKSGADLSGRRLYLFDDYHIESRRGVENRVNPATPHLAAWMKLLPGRSHWTNQVKPLFLTRENRLAIPFQDGEGTGYRPRYAVCPDPAARPEQWEIRDGAPPAAERRATPLLLPPAQRGDWRLKTPLDKATFRFYDRERDGIPPLDRICVLHTGVVKRDFSGLPIPYRSTYPVWEKTPGEILFLSREPLAVDTPLSGGEPPERENDTSDNFGGQHLSPDGKTLYYIAARVVKRYPPFIVGYDNQRNSNRLLTAWRTHDGFRWEKQFLLPVTDRDPWSLQQYGMRVFREPDSDLYWGFLSSYDCRKQQMYIDVVFSRDLLNWQRPGDAPFIANSDLPDDWRFGLILPPNAALDLGEKQFIFLPSVLGWPHCYFRDGNSAETIRRRYSIRGFEKMWPFFPLFKNYDALSASMKLAYTRRPIGVAESRPGGYLAVAAGENEGMLVTRPLRASGTLTLNGRTGKNGVIRVELLAPDGVPLPGMAGEFRGDKIDAPLFDRLPGGEFKMKITLRNAELFSLKFNKK